MLCGCRHWSKRLDHAVFGPARCKERGLRFAWWLPRLLSLCVLCELACGGLFLEFTQNVHQFRFCFKQSSSLWIEILEKRSQISATTTTAGKARGVVFEFACKVESELPSPSVMQKSVIRQPGWQLDHSNNRAVAVVLADDTDHCDWPRNEYPLDFQGKHPIECFDSNEALVSA